MVKQRYFSVYQVRVKLPSVLIHKGTKSAMMSMVGQMMVSSILKVVAMLKPFVYVLKMSLKFTPLFVLVRSPKILFLIQKPVILIMTMGN